MTTMETVGFTTLEADGSLTVALKMLTFDAPTAFRFWSNGSCAINPSDLAFWWRADVENAGIYARQFSRQDARAAKRWTKSAPRK